MQKYEITFIKTNFNYVENYALRLYFPVFLPEHPAC